MLRAGLVAGGALRHKSAAGERDAQAAGWDWTPPWPQSAATAAGRPAPWSAWSAAAHAAGGEPTAGAPAGPRGSPPRQGWSARGGPVDQQMGRRGWGEVRATVLLSALCHRVGHPSFSRTPRLRPNRGRGKGSWRAGTRGAERGFTAWRRRMALLYRYGRVCNTYSAGFHSKGAPPGRWDSSRGCPCWLTSVPVRGRHEPCGGRANGSRPFLIRWRWCNPTGERRAAHPGEGGGGGVSPPGPRTALRWMGFLHCKQSGNPAAHSHAPKCPPQRAAESAAAAVGPSI